MATKKGDVQYSQNGTFTNPCSKALNPLALQQEISPLRHIFLPGDSLKPRALKGTGVNFWSLDPS